MQGNVFLSKRQLQANGIDVGSGYVVWGVQLYLVDANLITNAATTLKCTKWKCTQVNGTIPGRSIVRHSILGIKSVFQSLITAARLFRILLDKIFKITWIQLFHVYV